MPLNNANGISNNVDPGLTAPLVYEQLELSLLCFPKTISLKSNIKEISLTKALLNADFILADVGKAGPELIAC